MMRRSLGVGVGAARQQRGLSYVLGIETSCDDTAAAVLDADGRVLSNVLSSQWELNAKWKGIVPALAARAHADNLPHVVAAALAQSGIGGVETLSAVAVTSGPGLSPCLDVGLRAAQQLCVVHPSVAFLQVNHLEAHVLVSRLPNMGVERPQFPFVALLVSGGHCCLVLAKGVGDYELLGSTLDDSVGEAFDKVARMLDMTSSRGVHGGRLIEEMAARGNDRAFPFTEPMKHRKARRHRGFEAYASSPAAATNWSDCDFSYSGIKTAVLREVRQLGALDDAVKHDLCASFQRRAVDQLVTRTRRACAWARERVGNEVRHLVVCGGVASNRYLRQRLQDAAEEEGLAAVFPPAEYCTDNGVMVAWTGVERYKLGFRSDPSSARYQPRWPLETLDPLLAKDVADAVQCT